MKGKAQHTMQQTGYDSIYYSKCIIIPLVKCSYNILQCSPLVKLRKQYIRNRGKNYLSNIAYTCKLSLHHNHAQNVIMHK